jgi:hypothetical protein
MQDRCHDPSRTIDTFENEGDHTHTAISIYLKTLNTFNQGDARRNPSVNSKKKPNTSNQRSESLSLNID